MSWIPDETSSELFVDRVDLSGAGLGNVAYGEPKVPMHPVLSLILAPCCRAGVHLTLFFMCFVTLWGKRAEFPKTTYGMLAYITALLIQDTLGSAAQMCILEQAYVNNRNYPGGPGTYETNGVSLSVTMMGSSAYVVNVWFVDGLLVRVLSLTKNMNIHTDAQSIL